MAGGVKTAATASASASETGGNLDTATAAVAALLCVAAAVALLEMGSFVVRAALLLRLLAACSAEPGARPALRLRLPLPLPLLRAARGDRTNAMGIAGDRGDDDEDDDAVDSNEALPLPLSGLLMLLRCDATGDALASFTAKGVKGLPRPPVL